MFAADWPGLPVTIEQQIGECVDGRSVEELELRSYPGEHVAPMARVKLAMRCGDLAMEEPGPNPPSDSCPKRRVVGSDQAEDGLRSRAFSLHSLRAALIGSMPASCHQAASLPTRWTSR
jgi:hypothetical protein